MMPRGPRGERRLRDVIACAVQVMKIGTGEVAEALDTPEQHSARALGRKGGSVRAANLSPERRGEIAQKAAAARWRKSGEE